MIRVNPLSSRFILATALVAAVPAASALAAPMFMKIRDIDGESKDDKHKGEIEILSFSWGTTPAGAKGNVEYSWRVEEGKKARPAEGERIADVERPKQSGASTATSDPKEKITIHAGRTEAKRTPPTVTLKRGTSRSAAPRRGVDIASVDGEIAPRGAAAAPMQYNPKEYTVSKDVVWSRAAPPSGSSGSLTAVVPAGSCTAGARFPTATVGAGGRLYELENVTVSSCTPAGLQGGGPAESMALNFTKISYQETPTQDGVR